jgi:hypothetical protein
MREALPPVLLMVFNRPEIARGLLGCMRACRPPQLFIAADGPRPECEADTKLCAETRNVFDEVDWPCEVKTLYQDTNLGLKTGVITAINWFFAHVESGVILEDDCHPTPGFLAFAGEVLERYADVPEVMHISGCNMQPSQTFSSASYFFTEVGHVWGWATWRRAWSLYDVTMGDWPSIRHTCGLTAPPLRRALGRKFSSAYAGRKASWSRIWYYTLVRYKGLAVIPSVNFVRNVGFGQDATHTKSDRSHPLRVDPNGEMTFPLLHPAELSPNKRYEEYLVVFHKGSYFQRGKEWSLILLDYIRSRMIS